jgi:hypothetical protein
MTGDLDLNSGRSLILVTTYFPLWPACLVSLFQNTQGSLDIWQQVSKARGATQAAFSAILGIATISAYKLEINVGAQIGLALVVYDKICF